VFTFVAIAIVAAFIIMRLRRNNGPGPGRNGGFPGQPFDRPDNQPRDGFTQRDYYGGFGQFGAQQPPAGQPPVPYEDSPEYLKNPPQPAPAQWQEPAPSSSSRPPAPEVPPVPEAPQGFRARKLAELDQQYSNGELSMEDYMARRAEIMKG